MFADFRIIVLFCVSEINDYLLTYLLYNFYVAAATGFTRIDITAIYIYIAVSLLENVADDARLLSSM